MNTVKKKILLVGGSPRKNGNSDSLIQSAAQGVADQQIDHEIVFLREYQFQPCVGCEQCRKDKICTRLNDGMTLLYTKIVDTHGILLASPVHHYNVTSWMKAFIDRLYCFYDFENTTPRAWSSRLAGQGRLAATIGVCEQVDKKDMGFVMEAMQWPLKALGYKLVGEQRVFGIFDRGKVRREPDLLEEAFKLGCKLAKAVRNG